MRIRDLTNEASPTTLDGSFSKDLIVSKLWLSNILSKILDNKNAGQIYILGSWYGNMCFALSESNIKYKNILLVEKNKNCLLKSKELLDDIYNQGKLLLIHDDAKNINYSEPCTIINTSINDMDTSWFDNVPKNSLVCIQSRNNLNKCITPTPDRKTLNTLYPLNKTIYLGTKKFNDIETDYDRFTKIGYM